MYIYIRIYVYAADRRAFQYWAGRSTFGSNGLPKCLGSGSIIMETSSSSAMMRCLESVCIMLKSG